MSGPRKKTFGPLLYAALVAWGLVAIFAGVETLGPRFQQWYRDRGSFGTCGVGSPDTLLCARAPGAAGSRARRPYVIEALRDPDAKVRVEACRVLANQGVELDRLITVLSEVVEDESPLVRFEAAACLGKISARWHARGHSRAAASPEQETELAGESVAILCRLLKDSSSDVRAEAARSLALACPADSPGRRSWRRPATPIEACAWPSPKPCCSSTARMTPRPRSSFATWSRTPPPSPIGRRS